MKPVKTEALSRNEKEWASELKWDGVRAIVYVDRISGKTWIQLSSGKDITGQFLEFHEGLAELARKHTLILDGEIVFSDGKKGTGKIPAVRSQISPPETDPKENPTRCYLFVFDLLYLDGRNFCFCSLTERRQLLSKLLSKSFQNKHGIAITPFWTKNHMQILQGAKNQGFEGIVLKRKDSTYHQGESKNWLKIKF